MSTRRRRRRGLVGSAHLAHITVLLYLWSILNRVRTTDSRDAKYLVVSRQQSRLPTRNMHIHHCFLDDGDGDFNGNHRGELLLHHEEALLRAAHPAVRVEEGQEGDRHRPHSGNL